MTDDIRNQDNQNTNNIIDMNNPLNKENMMNMMNTMNLNGNNNMPNMNNMNNMNMNNMPNMNNMNNMNMNNMPNMNNMNNMPNMNNMNNMNMNNMPNMNNMNNINNMNMFNPNDMQMMQYMLLMNSGMFNHINPMNVNNQNIPFNMNNMNNDEITINVHLNEQEERQIQFSQSKTVEELTNKIKEDFKISKFFKLMVKGKPLANKLSLAESCLENGSNVYLIFLEDRDDEKSGYVKSINIVFKMNKSNRFSKDNGSNLVDISKVCFLKEISTRLSDNNIDKFPEGMAIILKLLKKGKILNVNNLKDESKQLLEKIRQTNLLNLARYIDKAIDSSQIQNMLKLLNKSDFNEMKEYRNNLANLNNQVIMFEKDFNLARKKGIFEYSLVSLEIVDRPDVDDYEKASKKCPDKNERIMYYGTPEENVFNILLNHFSFSQNNKFGKGVYFSNSLDLSCIYAKESYSNNLKIPEVNEVFNFVISSVFYNESTRKRVMDNKYSPKKNEVNIAIVDGKLNALKDVDKSKFYSRQYVIADKSQILPFIHLKIKRNEYCVIWRDNNLSSKDVYNDKYDKVFKEFLKKRLEYISQYAKFNIYPCETTQEALKLVRKKKFNKIILMSNVGTDFGGRTFVNEARKIIGNDVITLFLAYMDEHLKWITKYKNALFSNIDEFHEQYLECFTDDSKTTKQNILTLKKSIEDHYKVQFNFDDNFLKFPYFKEDGEFKDLNF